MFVKGHDSLNTNRVQKYVKMGMITVTISKILIVILDTTQYTVISNFFKCIIVINMI